MVELGQIYVVRVVPAGEEDWRRLLVSGLVPVPPGEPVIWAVKQPVEQLETREILETTLLNDCDLETSL